MDIRNPIATWVLAKLYEEDQPISRKEILKKLCQASFESMSEMDEFSTIIKQLEDEKYIEYTRGNYTEYIPVQSKSSFATSSETKLQPVTKRKEGYEIGEAGIIAYRAQIISPLEKIKTQTDILPNEKESKFSVLTDKLKATRDVAEFAVKKCIENAPQILEFIKFAKSTGIQGI